MSRLLLTVLILVILIPFTPTCTVDALVIMLILLLAHFSAALGGIAFIVAMACRRLNLLGALVMTGIAYVLTFLVKMPDDD